MSDAFILRAGGGGGLSVNAAILHVQAPIGSTITLSKNNVVVKVLGPEKSHVNAHDNTLADWYYSVSSSNYGTWTVTATDGTDTASETLLINSANEYDIVLSYGVYLFSNGDRCIAVTGGWTNGAGAASTYTVVPVTISTAIDYIYSSNHEQCSAVTNNKITLYNGDIIRVNCSFTGKFSIYVISHNTTDWFAYYVLAEYVSFTTGQTVHELPITSNMQGYVLIGAFGQQIASSGHGSITNALIVRA